MDSGLFHDRNILAKVFAFLLVFHSGCGSQEPKKLELPPAMTNLRIIAGAYANATQSLDRPPRSKGELAPFLKKLGDPDQLLKAPDGSDFVIVWGFNMMDPRNVTVIWGYEREPKSGKRWVLKSQYTQEISEEEFRKSTFHHGHNK